MTATPTSNEHVTFNMSMNILVSHEHLIITEKSKNVLITCYKGVCSTVVIFYLPYLDYTSYNVIITHKEPILADMVELSLSCIDSNFTKYQLITKYTFLLISIIGYIQFIIFSRKIPFKL